MKSSFSLFLFIICIYFLNSCKSNDNHFSVEYITEGSYALATPPPTPGEVPLYPWTSQNREFHTPPITKEYFRCKGSASHPLRPISAKSKEGVIDCGGVEKHSLPLKNNQEYIYPILIELLNWVQQKTQKPVIITSGHRCPVHNTWVDPSPKNSASKHLIGAEVDFYVQGMEKEPDTIIATLLDFYKSHPRYAGKKEYIEFRLSEKLTNSSTPPLFNKEIFLKKFLAHEGRNEDNNHPYPYISIQVRYDSKENQAVMCTATQAQNYLRK